MDRSKIAVDTINHASTNKDRGFVQLTTNTSGTVYKTKGNLFKKIPRYKFYYKASLLPFSGAHYDSYYLKACSYLLISIIEEFNDTVYGNMTEPDQIMFKNELIDSMKEVPYGEEIYHLAEHMIKYGPEKEPSVTFFNEVDTLTVEHKSRYLLYKLLYFSIYNIEGYKKGTIIEEQFSEDIVLKTFSSFGNFDSNTHTNIPSILNDLGTFINELADVIDEILSGLIGTETKEITLTVNGNNYIIYYETDSESTILESTRGSYETAKTEFETAVKSGDTESANRIRKNLIADSYYHIDNITPGLPEIVNNYTFFAMKWLYYLFYASNTDSTGNKKRSTDHRGFRVVNHALNKNNIILNDNDINTLKNLSDKAKDVVIQRLIANKENHTFIVGRLIQDIEAELTNIERNVMVSKEGVVIDEVGLNGINPKYNKKIYNRSQTVIFNSINRYWEDLKSKYEEKYKEGDKEYANFLRKMATGVAGYDLPPWVSQITYGIEINDEASGTIILSDEYEGAGVFRKKDAKNKHYLVVISKIEHLAQDFLNLLDSQYEEPERYEFYNITDLYTFFSYYDYSKSLGIKDLGEHHKEFRYEPFGVGATPDMRSTSGDFLDRDASLKQFRKELSIEIDRILSMISSGIDKLKGDQDSNEGYLETLKVYTENELELLKNKVDVEDFFYVDRKYLPMGKKVDIEFQVYNKNFNKSKFISVSKRTGRAEPIDDYYVYEDNYFESFVMKDVSGDKTIELVLKSKDETNLEDIIYNSMIGPINKFNESEYTNDIDNIYNFVKNKEVHFKLRFGYSDDYGDRYIDDDSLLGNDYRGRTNYNNHRPVKQSPWINFVIKGITSRTINDEMIYEISAMSTGADMLNSFSVFTPSPSKLSFRGSPSVGIIEIGKIINSASAGKICLIGKDDNTVISKDSTVENIKYDTITFEEKEVVISGSLEEVPHKWFFEGLKTENDAYRTGDRMRTLDLAIEAKRNENGILSIREILDSLVNWLPKKIYIVKEEEGEKYAEEFKASEHARLIGSENTSIISLSPTYEVIEAMAKLPDDNTYNEKTLIRIFYKGPKKKTDIGFREAVRKYSFRHKQNTVVKSLSIENEVNLGNVMDYCTIVGTGLDAISVFSSKYSIDKNKDSDYPTTGGMETVDGVDNNKFLIVPKKNYITLPTRLADGISEEDKTRYLQGISNDHVANMEVWPFKGVLEILGDPYFLIDDKLQVSSHKVFLDINRLNKDGVSDIENFIKRSYYTGIYIITGVEHEMRSDGDFVTRLSVVKDVTR